MSPEEAVSRAFWMVKVPSMAFMLGPWLAFIALAGLGIIPRYGNAGLAWFLPTFLGGFTARLRFAGEREALLPPPRRCRLP